MGPPVVDFAGLYRRYAPDVHRFALLLSGDHALAEDIVSETFIRLWNARVRVDLATVKGFLLTIARNLYLHERRRHGRTAALEDRHPDAGPRPDDRLQARRELASVMAALQVLPEIDRAALLMRADDDMPYEEIAAALGISVVAAKVKVHRARLRLAEVRRRAGAVPAAGDAASAANEHAKEARR